MGVTFHLTFLLHQQVQLSNKEYRVALKVKGLKHVSLHKKQQFDVFLLDRREPPLKTGLTSWITAHCRLASKDQCVIIAH